MSTEPPAKKPKAANPKPKNPKPKVVSTSSTSASTVKTPFLAAFYALEAGPTAVGAVRIIDAVPIERRGLRQ